MGYLDGSLGQSEGTLAEELKDLAGDLISAGAVAVNGRINSLPMRTASSASGDTSGATDAAALQAAINATPAGGTLWLSPGTYYLNAGLSITTGISLRGISAQYGTTQTQGVSLVAASGTTGKMINVNPVSLTHAINVENIGIDLSNATGMTGVYVTNVDNSVFRGLFVRDGATAYQLDDVQLFTMRDCLAFNQRTRGFYSSHASNVDIRFDNCIYEQTVGATWAATSGWDIANGASFQFINCEALRSPAGSGNWLSYGINVTSPAATTWLFMLNCWLDALSDGTGANSANSCALNLTSSVINVRATNCFMSASSSSGQKQRAVRVNGGSDHQFVNCTFGGSGIEFATGNVTRMGISNSNFVQQFSDPAIAFTGGAAPTLLTFQNNTLQSPSSGIVGSAADAASLLVATNGSSSGS